VRPRQVRPRQVRPRQMRPRQMRPRQVRPRRSLGEALDCGAMPKRNVGWGRGIDGGAEVSMVR